MPGLGLLPSIRIHARWILAVYLLGSTAAAQDKDKKDNTVGGHIGFALPLVTHSRDGWTSLNDNLQLALPLGITIKGPGRLNFDLELFNVIQDSPRNITTTIHPGLVYSLGHGFSVGGRFAFVIPSTQFGLTPILIKSWPIRNGGLFKSFFIEFDFPVRFDRPNFAPSTNTFTFIPRIAVGF